LATSALIIASAFFVLGLIGTVMPFLPGAVLIYIGMLIYGFMTDFATLGFSFYLFQGVVFAFLFLVDYLAGMEGARRFGGSKQASWGAALGMVAGLFFAPLGLLLGPFLGAVGAELLFRKTDFEKAIRVGFGTLVGILGGTLVKVGLEIIMIFYFFLKI